ncbi:ParB/RepB/Spo0J family partition protein [Actinocorallia longicatena]|uniref:ParB N-terminal domain-containing protein n=1 Tax=Actinocorallia longicatena TaxID=111803 RepID=A0ABP6QC87_9ACTN
MDEVTEPQDDHEVHEVPIATLLPAYSPRSATDKGHVRTLAEAEGSLPPIIVDRATLRVVDGMHRLQAALSRGAETISVRYFDGDEPAAFVLAVRLNSEHGLPLTLAERKDAALRIMNYHPEWSDRAIAAIAGLSDKTVGAIRRRAGSSIAQLDVRIGRDNESHPLNPKEGRLRASELFAENPTASTREVARLSGISATTAKDVRNRLLHGEDPVPPRQRITKPIPAEAAPIKVKQPIQSLHSHDRRRAIDRLKADPSLRFSESGRMLLRWLDVMANQKDQWDTIANNLPGHCAQIVAELARQCSDDWQHFAATVEHRIDAVS